MKIVERGIVWENPKPYLRTRHAMHPTIVDLGGGELVCAHDIGEAPESMDYETWCSRSLDYGSTWTLEGQVNRETNEITTTSMVRISKAQDGLVGIGARMYRENPEDGILNRENLGYARMDLIQMRSGDGGHSWSLPETIIPPLEGPAFEVSHAIVPLPNGRWLAPMATWRGWDGRLPNGEKSLVLISDDLGKTYPSYGVTFDGTADGLIHWEQSVAVLQDERIFSVAWVYHPESGTHRPNRYTISEDGGETFLPAREVGLQGQTCKVCALRDGRLLFAYRRQDKPGLWTQLASLSGDTITLHEELPLWGTGMQSSGMQGNGDGADELSALKFGFPQMVQLEDGCVFLVFWAFHDWSCKIHFLRIEVK